MRGVTFGNNHTYWEWGLMMKSAPIVYPPEPKTHYVDVPGAHGALDLTELLTGKVQYANRKLHLEFTAVADRERWAYTYRDILEALHGKRLDMVLDDEPEYTYTGRVTVGYPKWDRKHVTLTMTVEADPHKRTADGRKVL